MDWGWNLGVKVTISANSAVTDTTLLLNPNRPTKLLYRISGMNISGIMLNTCNCVIPPL